MLFWTFSGEPFNTGKHYFTLCFYISYILMDIRQFTISQTASEHGRTSASLII